MQYNCSISPNVISQHLTERIRAASLLQGLGEYIRHCERARIAHKLNASKFSCYISPANSRELDGPIRRESSRDAKHRTGVALLTRRVRCIREDCAGVNSRAIERTTAVAESDRSASTFPGVWNKSWEGRKREIGRDGPATGWLAGCLPAWGESQ